LRIALEKNNIEFHTDSCDLGCIPKVISKQKMTKRKKTRKHQENIGFAVTKI